MPREDLQTYQHNLSLKKEFGLLGLDLDPVFDFTPLDLDLENRRLESLLDFVKRYQQYGSQDVMEKVEGECCWPPIYPGISPDSDWYRFGRWMRGESVSEPIINQFSLHEKFLPSDKLGDTKIESELERLIETIEATGNGVSLQDNIPARLVYKALMEWIGENHELSGPFGGGWFYDGCSGWCPGCFQRPWCESGNRSCWPEDEEAGKIHFIDELKDYVSASPQSFDIISKLQTEHDECMKKWMEESGGEETEDGPFFDHDGLRSNDGDGDDLPF